MNNRIPSFFQLDKYDITPEDVVQNVLQCKPIVIQPKVIVTPFWKAEIFSKFASQITEIVPGIVYELEYQGECVSLIRSGIGAPQTGDVTLALSCTPCETVIFTGSVGGLTSNMRIGDLVLVERSFSGDGFSRYLDANILPNDYFLQEIEPDHDLTQEIMRHAIEICQSKSVPLHQGGIFSADSILAQFFRLDYLVDRSHCIGIEMETAAVFRVAKLTGIKAGAVLQVSDTPRQNKSLYTGRTKEEMEQRKFIKQEVLPQVLLNSILAL